MATRIPALIQLSDPRVAAQLVVTNNATFVCNTPTASAVQCQLQYTTKVDITSIIVHTLLTKKRCSCCTFSLPLMLKVTPLSPRSSPGAKTIKKNTNSTQNKFQTHRAKQYEVTSFLSTDCELSTETCSKNVYSLGHWAIARCVVLERHTPSSGHLGPGRVSSMCHGAYGHIRCIKHEPCIRAKTR